MNLSLEKTGTVVIIRIKDGCWVKDGGVNPETMQQIKQQMLKLFEEGTVDFVIELQGMGWFPGDGLPILVSAFKLAIAHNGKVKLSGVSPQAKESFELYRFDRVFEIFPTLQEALDSFISRNPIPFVFSEMEFTKTKLKRSLWLRARWAQNYFELPEMDKGKMLTLIASCLPWKYYCVATIQMDTFSPLSKLARTLQTNSNYKDVPDEIMGFKTQIFRCDKMGFVKSYNNPLFEQEYLDLSSAIIGHKETVKKFSKGAPVYSPSGICKE